MAMRSGLVWGCRVAQGRRKDSTGRSCGRSQHSVRKMVRQGLILGDILNPKTVKIDADKLYKNMSNVCQISGNMITNVMQKRSICWTPDFQKTTVVDGVFSKWRFGVVNIYGKSVPHQCKFDIRKVIQKWRTKHQTWSQHGANICSKSMKMGTGRQCKRSHRPQGPNRVRKTDRFKPERTSDPDTILGRRPGEF